MGTCTKQECRRIAVGEVRGRAVEEALSEVQPIKVQLGSSAADSIEHLAPALGYDLQGSLAIFRIVHEVLTKQMQARALYDLNCCRCSGVVPKETIALPERDQ